MSRNYNPDGYRDHNPEGVYFVSFAVVEWLDVFTRVEYKDILIESLEYCQREKGMEIFAWCIMTVKAMFTRNYGIPIRTVSKEIRQAKRLYVK